MAPRKLTKMICTVSDMNYEHDYIKKLYDLGMDAVRLNTAHQAPAETEKIINTIRGVSENIAILLDTKGAEMRTMGLKYDLVVLPNDEVKIAAKTFSFPETPLFQVNYDFFVEKVPAGTTIYIDEGLIELIVIDKNKDFLLCRVIKGGTIKNKRSVNVPSINMYLPGLTTRDIDYINLAIKNDIDFIAHSFVRNKEDIMNLQEILNREKSDIKIIAKIENREGLNNFDEILQQAYGILIARGDLGVEIPGEEVPLLQKSIIRKCRQTSKPVLVATHLLDSMIRNPRPTQAEISDVANAVLDGADLLVLTGETAEGEYPFDSAQTITGICNRIESEKGLNREFEIKDSGNDPTHFLIRQAVKAATELPVKAIISTSANDFTVRLLSTYRSCVPVFVSCYSKRDMREYALNYGIYAQYIEKEKQDQFFSIMFHVLLKEWNIQEKDLIVTLSDSQKHENGLDKMEIISLGECLTKVF
ncbi:pyruvate kinase [candidate division KSB1 bacterium]|nr:pyruvate kinase [candidate division KSB1 bacterium]